MSKIIIEDIKSKNVKKYIVERSEPNGHDCWGKTEWSLWNVIVIDGKDELIYESKDISSQYIAHDGEKAIYVGSIDSLPKWMMLHMDPSAKEKEKAKRYKEYLKLKKEFDIESDENKRIKRDVNIENLTS